MSLSLECSSILVKHSFSFIQKHSNCHMENMIFLCPGGLYAEQSPDIDFSQLAKINLSRT